MTFSIIDFIVGVLLFEGIVHLTFSVTQVEMPSLFGSSPKANMILGLALVFFATDIYFFMYGLSATLNNSILMAMLVLTLILALTGRLVQKAMRSRSKIHEKQTGM